MRKFKVGDKVKIIKPQLNYNYPLPVGYVGIIEEYRGGDWYGISGHPNGKSGFESEFFTHVGLIFTREFAPGTLP